MDLNYPAQENHFSICLRTMRAKSQEISDLLCLCPLAPEWTLVSIASEGVRRLIRKHSHMTQVGPAQISIIQVGTAQVRLLIWMVLSPLVYGLTPRLMSKSIYAGLPSASSLYIVAFSAQSVPMLLPQGKQGEPGTPTNVPFYMSHKSDFGFLNASSLVAHSVGGLGQVLRIYAAVS